MSDTSKDPTDPAPSVNTQKNPLCHCPECGKTTTFEHELSERCDACGRFVCIGKLPPLNTGYKPKDPTLAVHPFVTDGSTLVVYRLDCPVCKKTTTWSADVTGAWCAECRKIFVSRGRIKDAPTFMSKDPIKSPHPIASEGETIYYDATCPDCRKQTRWRADVTGVRCIKCGCFLKRDRLKNAPIITPKDAVKQPQPPVVSEVVEKCIVCGGDEPCSHDFDAMAAQETQGFTKAAPPPEKPYTGPPEDYLNDAALTKLIMAATKARLHTAEEISHLLEWAHRAHLESCLLDLVLNGNLLFQWSPEGPQFFAPEKAPEEPVPASVTDSQPSDTTEKPVEQPSEKSQRLQLLDRLAAEAKEDPIDGEADMSLWCLLSSCEDRLPPLDINFLGRFRHEAVAGYAHVDMAIWYLLQSSQRFWRIFNEVRGVVRSPQAGETES